MVKKSVFSDPKPPKTENVQIEDGEPVVLHGLKKNPELNDQVGNVVGYDALSCRYMVKLTANDDDYSLSESMMRVKACNLFSAVEVDDISNSEVAASASFLSNAGSQHYVGS